MDTTTIDTTANVTAATGTVVASLASDVTGIGDNLRTYRDAAESAGAETGKRLGLATNAVGEAVRRGALAYLQTVECIGDKTIKADMRERFKSALRLGYLGALIATNRDLADPEAAAKQYASRVTRLAEDWHGMKGWQSWTYDDVAKLSAVPKPREPGKGGKVEKLGSKAGGTPHNPAPLKAAAVRDQPEVVGLRNAGFALLALLANARISWPSPAIDGPRYAAAKREFEAALRAFGDNDMEGDND